MGVLPDQMDNPVKTDMLDFPETLVLPERTELTVPPVPTERRELTELTVLLEREVTRVPREPPAHPVLTDQTELMVKTEMMVLLDPVDPMVSTERLALRETPDLLVLRRLSHVETDFAVPTTLIPSTDLKSVIYCWNDYQFSRSSLCKKYLRNNNCPLLHY